MTRSLNILTWHIHGTYLSYMVHNPVHTFYLPIKPGRPEGYGGRIEGMPPNVHEVASEEVKDLPLDCVVFQSRKNYEVDQDEILSPSQQRLPRIYLEHDPPREHPTDTGHFVDDPEVLLVHVTGFNDLMWDSGRTPTRVIEHAVVVPDAIRYIGELERGVVVINNLALRGRRLGKDVFERVRREIPLDLYGINYQEMDGQDSLGHPELFEVMARYRFFFNPIRYTSLGLAVCEAMTIGLPIVGLATTEMVTVIENDVSGYIDTSVDRLIVRMRELLKDPETARRLGQGAQQHAKRRFNVQRFAADWNAAYAHVTGSAVERGRVMVA